jgi:Ras-related protein Rab-11A
MGEMAEEAPRKLKLAFVGQAGVGKTNLLLRVFGSPFQPECSPTLSLDFRTLSFQLDGTPLELQLWDTSGEERYDSLMPAHLHGADGVFIVYDVTNQLSFEKVDRSVRSVEEMAPQGVARFLVGNQIDRHSERVVQADDGGRLAKQHGLGFIETSAADGTNVSEMMTAMVRRLAAEQNAIFEHRSPGAVALGAPSSGGAWRCCW